MLSISTIPEALAELEKQTGRAWTDSDLFDLAANCGIELHAAPPITAQTTIQKFVVGVGLVEKFRSPPGHAALAVLFPKQVGQLWLSGETLTSHPSKHDEIEGEYKWFTEPVRVTREQVRIKAATLEKILTVWSESQPAPAQNTATPAPAPVVPVSASGGVEADKAGPLPLTTGDIAFCFAGLRCQTEKEWKDLIGKGRDWVERCLVQPGTRGRGGAPKLWNPVCIGAALVRDGHAKSNSVRAKFQTQPLLKPWLDEWKTYEADNFDSN